MVPGPAGIEFPYADRINHRGGVANQLMAVKTGTSGADWGQAANIGKSLLVSPLVGFAMAAVLLLIAKATITDQRLYDAPEGTEPSPF